MNPLLTIEQFPDYAAIEAKFAEPAIEQTIASCKNDIDEILQSKPASFLTYTELEAVDDRLSKVFSPISHLHSVNNTEEWRAAYETCQQRVSEYGAELSQYTPLYEFYCQLKASDEYQKLDAKQQRVIDNAIRDFELSGVGLSDEDKLKYRELVQSLSQLSMSFANNVLDATQSFGLHITDKSELAGIPDSAIRLYQQLAENNEVEGYWLTLDFPSYYPAISYAENRQLRQKLHDAYVTRASELGPNAGEFDNGKLIPRILELRHELATLLGFDNYAELSLANKMADSPAAVNQFLEELKDKAKSAGLKEFSELENFAKTNHGLEKIEPWDVAYLSEKLREQKYQISQEELRDYFPVTKVVQGLFSVTEKLFSVQFEAINTLSKWHPDVLTYAVKSGDETIAYFYLDLYARQGKQGGAWMNGAIDRISSSFIQQKPVAYLTCNFIPPTGGDESYLSHDEVMTLFHEFGHGLHHMLTKVDYSPISGINGVEWDAVELPSQFMEIFCYLKSVLSGMTAHRDTGEPLPDTLFEKLEQSKNFHSALMMLRQLEFAMFDMKIHQQSGIESTADVMTLLQAVKKQVAVTPSVDYNRFPMSFSHIFAGGYAAGYYSYKWAEVLSADAFARFEEEGVFEPAVGQAFKAEVLERGASRSAADNFAAFRGRAPKVDALLRHSGIIA